jgi:general secretion pathway protein I
MVRARRRRSAEPRSFRGASGFTLVEILVALAVVAVALAAGMRAVAQSADAATLLKQRTLALWVAQNRLASAQLEAPWPAVGGRNGQAAQAGAAFVWRESVSGTPNPAFRRIEIVVGRRSRAGLRPRPPHRVPRADDEAR